MFLLQKVIAVMEDETQRTAMEELSRTLKKEGIGLLCFWTNEAASKERTAERILESVRKPKEPCLWFSDRADMVKVLRELKEPVLALYHERNQEQDLSAALYACETPQELEAEYLERVYRRYLGISWEILETRRLFLRETVPEDAEAFYSIYEEPEITRYTEGLYPDREQEKQYLREYIEKVYGFYGFGVWTIILRETGEIIGRAGLSCREGFEDAELGFVIGTPWQRKGFGEEICRAILQYAWENLELEKVQAFVCPENEASLRLCRKLGMHDDGMVTMEGTEYCRLIINRR